ncbi:hypothetical protein BGZ82_004106 [Podila clonocystis]|nr:hypothetical protein BGZ82_004106 [Podila clonocystis]
MSDHPQPNRTLSGNTDPSSASSSAPSQRISPLSVATSFAHNNHAGGASSGFAFPAAKPFTPSKPNPPTLLSLPTFSPNQTPTETPLGSPEAELEKLNLGVERYARAIEDPGIGGSFLGTVPLPSFAPAQNQANKRRPSLMDPLSGAGTGPHTPGTTTTTDSSGLNLSSIKRAITGRLKSPETGEDLESYTRGGGEITDMDLVVPVKEKSESHVVNFDLDTKEGTTAETGVRRRKPKGGILSQLLKLQRNEAVAAASSSSKGSHSPTRDDRKSSGQHASVKKTKKGFYYRSSSRNSSMTSLKDLSASVSTTPRASPRSSRIFDQDRSTEDESTLTSPTARKASRKSGLRGIRAIRQGDNDGNRSIHHDIAEILTRQSFLIMMAKALILYGAPSHRIEETCLQLAKKMDVDASFSLLPGHMTISFSDPDTHTSDTRHLRCTQGMDMHKLSCVYTIALGVLRGEPIETANKELERVAQEPGCFPLWLQVLAWMGSSACVAPLAFNGSWIDTALAGLCGLIVGILGMVAAKFPIYGPLFEMTSSIVVGFIARALGDHVCFSAVALAGVVVLLPGLVLTQAIMELASRNIVSGAVRMFYALMYAFFLGFGLSLGAELWVYLSGDNTVASASACAQGINHFWYFLIYPAVSASINIVFNAHPRQWFGMTLVTAVGFVVTYFLKGGPQVTSAIAAFAVGITGQLYGRLTGQLSYVPMLSGVLLLVPGSVGVKGILAIIGSDPAKGFTFVLAMINSSSAITLGVFCSALVWYPFWRRSTFMNF